MYSYVKNAQMIEWIYKTPRAQSRGYWSQAKHVMASNVFDMRQDKSFINLI